MLGILFCVQSQFLLVSYGLKRTKVVDLRVPPGMMRLNKNNKEVSLTFLKIRAVWLVREREKTVVCSRGS
jgi:hypothetical protein